MGETVMRLWRQLLDDGWSCSKREVSLLLANEETQKVFFLLRRGGGQQPVFRLSKWARRRLLQLQLEKRNGLVPPSFGRVRNG